ncbi:MAG: carbonic anhydrase family protein [Chitinophagaceae bacterium]
MKLVFAVSAILMISSCSSSKTIQTVYTAAQQQALTPDQVLQNLKDGNSRFVQNNMLKRNLVMQAHAASNGQYPEAAIISCIDSRIPVEQVFDAGIGDMFVGRVAGNFVNTDLLGSLEFACKVMGSKVIVILGHSSCGAVKSAIDQVKLGNITAMLSNIQPAIALSQNFQYDKSSKNDAYTDLVAKNNVLHTIEVIKQDSPILNDMLHNGTIKIVGAMYDIKTGIISFIE